jgi:hypothetical protein
VIVVKKNKVVLNIANDDYDNCGGDDDGDGMIILLYRVRFEVFSEMTLNIL